jgi:hypothetical protein
MTTRNRRIIVWALAAAAFLLIVRTARNPIRQSGEQLRLELLEETPRGASMEDVKRLIQKKGWTIRVYDENRGFLDQRRDGDPQLPPPDPLIRVPIPITGGWVTGAKNIEVHLGDYLPVLDFPTSVNLFWGFDRESRLIDIWVWKTNDAL